MSDTKSNIRSFRYSDKVSAILENFKGNSLNEKFNNLVIYCFDRLEQRTKDLADIENQIEQKRNTYHDLCKKLSDIDDLMRTLELIKRYGDIAVRGAKAISEGEHIGSAKIK